MASLINDLSKEWCDKEKEYLQLIEAQRKEIEELKKINKRSIPEIKYSSFY